MLIMSLSKVIKKKDSLSTYRYYISSISVMQNTAEGIGSLGESGMI